ncbi:MAG: dockerin type I domain-containing protein [Desulfobulbus sp.]
MQNRGKKREMARRLACLGGAVLCLVAFQPWAQASDFDTYKTAHTPAVIDLPTVENGWFTAAEYFPAESTAMIDGRFQVRGRLLAANNTTIYMQRTYGSSVWDPVARIEGGVMDPSFIHVSPDGSKIALGIGHGAPLLIIPTDILSIQNPPVLTGHPQVTSFPQVNYYDGTWAKGPGIEPNRYFVINGGQWPAPGGSYASGVGVVDTLTANPATHTGAALVVNIPGASGDVEVDREGNLLTGLGHAAGPPNRTGELKVWAPGEWDPANPVALDYNANPKIVATNILSVAHLGEDAEGNLHMGGGDAFGSGGPDENGYAVLIRQGVVSAIASGARTTPVNDGNLSDNAEYQYFAPDPYRDDSATGVLAGNWGRGLAVMWNPTSYEQGQPAGPPGSATEYWLPGVTPRLTVYYPASAPDSDGDGIPDGADNAYLTPNPGQEDTDGDGYGNAADADFNNDGVVNLLDANIFKTQWGIGDTLIDMNGDGIVDLQDANMFRNRWKTSEPSAPYY